MQPDLSRRRFLGLTVATAGSLLGASGCGSDDASPPVRSAFPQSVASGDPRPTSVVLWTRVVDAARPELDVELELELGTDPDFDERFDFGGAGFLRVEARAELDHCVRVRVEALEPGTTYYYRFRRRGASGVVSPTGRTRTAPAADADVPVRFAVVCCQDYDDKYFHAYRALLARDVDFVVHLGDYVYERHGRSPSSARATVFGRPEEALDLGGGGLAARSLDNYRDLYRTARSDPDLQAAHERFPFIVIWDDHEFANDCHGATSTYRDGREDETDLERRRAADRAWFEYMPVDYTEAPASAFDAERAFPDDLAIYRSFAFGRHLELAMTDSRRYRPDHLVPENAFPGAVFVTEAELVAAGDAAPAELVPCVDIDTFADGAYRDALAARAEALDLDAAALAGLVSVPFLNELLAQATGDDLPQPIDPELPDLERGFAYHQILKTSSFSSLGARYLVSLVPFRALAKKRYLETGGESERLLGAAQRAWLLETLRASTRTFKVWGSELVFMPRQLDLRAVEAVPPELRAELAISAEDWDGCPNERAEFLEELADAGNVVILSGDVHCFFAGTPYEASAPERRLVEITTGSISSTTWLEAVGGIVADAGAPPSVAMAASAVGALLTDRVARPNPHLAFHELEKNGFSVVEAGADALDVELVFLSPEDVATETLPQPVEERLTSERLRVPADGSGLEREISGELFGWDVATMSWVRA